MKLDEIYQQDYSADAGKNLSDEDFNIAYEAILPMEFSIEETKELAEEIVERGYSRTVGSAFFTLCRMHILVHGVAPHGMSEKSAEGMFLPSRRMEAFVEAKGHDVDGNIAAARAEIKRRPKKIKRDEAKKLMVSYARDHRGEIPRLDYVQRDKLIKMIMSGLTPEEAFAQF